MAISKELNRGRHCVSAWHSSWSSSPSIATGSWTETRSTACGCCLGRFAPTSNPLETDGQDTHVHLVVRFPPKVAISKLVNSLKGVSSRMLRQERPGKAPCGDRKSTRLNSSHTVISY